MPTRAEAPVSVPDHLQSGLPCPGTRPARRPVRRLPRQSQSLHLCRRRGRVLRLAGACPRATPVWFPLQPFPTPVARTQTHVRQTRVHTDCSTHGQVRHSLSLAFTESGRASHPAPRSAHLFGDSQVLDCIAPHVAHRHAPEAVPVLGVCVRGACQKWAMWTHPPWGCRPSAARVPWRCRSLPASAGSSMCRSSQGCRCMFPRSSAPPTTRCKDRGELRHGPQ